MKFFLGMERKGRKLDKEGGRKKEEKEKKKRKKEKGEVGRNHMV